MALFEMTASLFNATPGLVMNLSSSTVGALAVNASKNAIGALATGALAMNVPNNSMSALAMNVSSNAKVALATNATHIASSIVTSNVSTLLNASRPHHIPEVVASTFMLHSVLALAVVANGFLYISPLNVVMRVLREQTQVKDLTSWLVPTYLMFAQSYLWACYGICTGLADLVRFNLFGAVVSAACLVVISKNAHPRKVAERVIVGSILMVVLFSVGVWMFSGSALVRSGSFGHAATAFNIGMVVAPLVDAARVMETRMLDKFPLTIVLASFFASVLWAQYAVLVHDTMLLVPNLIGAVVCGLELSAIYLVAWGGSATGAGSLLLEVDSQPLMPRKQGKSKMSSCGNFLSFLGAGKREPKQRRAPQADPRDIVRTKLRDHFRYSTFDGASSEVDCDEPLAHGPAGPMVYDPFMVSKLEASTKSPFSAFGNVMESDVEDLEAWAADEPEFEPESMGQAMPFVARNPTLDCIL